MSAQRMDGLSESDRLLLIGRDRELAQFDATLESRRSTFIVVSGNAGVGKSRLLRAFRLRALEQGRHPAGGDREIILSVQPTTTEATFREVVLSLLTTSSDTSHTNPVLRISRLHPLDSLVEQLSRSASVVLIDGYRPNPDFAGWFEKRFVSDVKRTKRSPIVVVVADRPDEVAPLKRFADEFISLEPLDSQSLQLLFATIGRQVNSQMTSEELRRYIEAVQNDPGILESLTRVLMLPQEYTPSTVGNEQ